MNAIITNNISKILSLCKKYKVKELYAFGSVTSEKYKTKSDVDLHVEFSKIPTLKYSDYYFNLKNELVKVFKREVDLLVLSGLKNRFFMEELNETKQKIYAES